MFTYETWREKYKTDTPFNGVSKDSIVVNGALVPLTRTPTGQLRILKANGKAISLNDDVCSALINRYLANTAELEFTPKHVEAYDHALCNLISRISHPIKGMGGFRGLQSAMADKSFYQPGFDIMNQVIVPDPVTPIENPEKVDVTGVVNTPEATGAVGSAEATESYVDLPDPFKHSQNNDFGPYKDDSSTAKSNSVIGHEPSALIGEKGRSSDATTEENPKVDEIPVQEDKTIPLVDQSEINKGIMAALSVIVDTQDRILHELNPDMSISTPSPWVEPVLKLTIEQSIQGMQDKLKKLSGKPIVDLRSKCVDMMKQYTSVRFANNRNDSFSKAYKEVYDEFNKIYNTNLDATRILWIATTNMKRALSGVNKPQIDHTNMNTPGFLIIDIIERLGMLVELYFLIKGMTVTVASNQHFPEQVAR